jgi:hypothetical protein
MKTIFSLNRNTQALHAKQKLTIYERIGMIWRKNYYLDEIYYQIVRLEGEFMLLLSDKLSKSILDPIHGLIKMTETEMKIISHPLFNRLRRIKQNTFLYYVFPSANHTRFECFWQVGNVSNGN